MTTLVLFTGRRMEGTALVAELARLIDMGEHVRVLIPYNSLGSITDSTSRTLHERGVRFYTINDQNPVQSEEIQKPAFVAELQCRDAIKLVEGSERILSWTY